MKIATIALIAGLLYPYEIATAQSAPSPEGACGVGGTARLAHGAMVTRTDAEAVGTRVGADGYWWTCNAAPAKPPVLKDCGAPNINFREWVVDNRACTTADKYATRPTSPARDRVIRHGQIAAWHQWLGPMRGYLIERCDDGVRTVAASTCAPVTECDVKFATSNDGGRTVYTYDARPRAARVPVGAYAEAVAPNGRTLRIQCVAGDLRAAPLLKPRTSKAQPH